MTANRVKAYGGAAVMGLVSGILTTDMDMGDSFLVMLIVAGAWTIFCGSMGWIGSGK